MDPILSNIRPLLLALVIVLSPSCKQEESIAPFANARTLAQAQGRDPELTIVRGAFTFDELDVANPVGDVQVPILGNFLTNLASAFANLFILINKDWEIEQEPIALEIPDIDSDIFINLNLKTLQFQIKGGTQDKKASLNFIEEIDIYLATKEMLANNEGEIYARYRFNKAQLKRCKEKCIYFNLMENEEGESLNLMPLLTQASLSEDKKIYIIPKIKINSVPKANFKIDGNIDFKLGFKAPF